MENQNKITFIAMKSDKNKAQSNEKMRNKWDSNVKTMKKIKTETTNIKCSAFYFFL